MKMLSVHRLGRVDYTRGLTLQREARDRVLRGGSDELLLLEHDPVVTAGKRGGAWDEAALERLRTPVVRVDRGGLATWHGPGQLVGYPIVDLRRLRRSVPQFVDALGAILEHTCATAGLPDARYEPERPGVYRAGRKLASIGLHIHRGVTSHGFALNIACDLAGFRAIEPCGDASLAVSDLARETGREVGLEAIVASLLGGFEARLGLTATPGPPP